jgi:putative ubiquitin-RnfH superfamily antitoxin RatB of RatAB toxin-antitoxin module
MKIGDKVTVPSSEVFKDKTGKIKEINKLFIKVEFSKNKVGIYKKDLVNVLF